MHFFQTILPLILQSYHKNLRTDIAVSLMVSVALQMCLQTGERQVNPFTGSKGKLLNKRFKMTNVHVNDYNVLTKF